MLVELSTGLLVIRLKVKTVLSETTLLRTHAQTHRLEIKHTDIQANAKTHIFIHTQ